MAEKSYFWTDGGPGDASLSPYSAEEFNLFQFMPLAGDGSNEAYIIPGYLGDLLVSGVGGINNSVTVKAGAALVNGYLYVLDTDTLLPIDFPSAGNYRRDIVALRYQNNKVRLVVIKGHEGAVPVIPTLTQDSNIFEVALAVVYTEPRSSLTNQILTYIVDRRKFIYTAYTKEKFAGKVGNLLSNSEWLAFSQDGTAYKVPDYWAFSSSSGVNPTFNRTTITPGSGRSNQAISIAGSSSLYLALSQAVQVKGSVFTLYGYYELLSTSGIINTIVSGYIPGETSPVFVRSVFVKNQSLTDDGYFQMTFTLPDGVDHLEIKFIMGDVTLGQVVLKEGYHPGDFQSVNEILMLKTPITDASWNATAKSTATTTINLGVSFGGFIKNHVRAVVLRLRARDSGSAASANNFLAALGYAAPFNAVYGRTDLGGVSNDSWRETYCIVPVDQIYTGTGAAGAQFRLQVQATGAGTLDATVQIVGIVI